MALSHVEDDNTQEAASAAEFLPARKTLSALRSAACNCEGSIPAVATYHPSAVLRAPHTEDRQQMRADLIADLRVAARAAHEI